MSTQLGTDASSFRIAEIGKREALGDLLDHGFGVPQGRRFFDDFPIWDPAIVPPGPKLVRLGAWERDRLVASAGLRLAKLLPEGVPVALIGAVATDPAFRGQGLASRLTEELVARAERAGAKLALLWGSEHRMYARLGFALTGAQIRAPLSKLALGGGESGPSAPSRATAHVERGWADGIFPLLRARERGIALEEGDLAWYRMQKSVSWYRAERGGAIVAYAGLGRGIDLQNIVHEWGGEQASLGLLLTTILREHPQAELLGPADSHAFGLNRHPVESLALVRVISGAMPPLWIWGLDAV